MEKMHSVKTTEEIRPRKEQQYVGAILVNVTQSMPQKQKMLVKF